MEATIAAISTGLTPSGIIIVRMSGSEALTVADKVFRGRKGLTPSCFQTHTIHHGYIYEGETVIDEVMLSVMKAPHTYTGEDIVEINCHGGILVSKKILELLVENGAKLAEPGEFTKRAFLNGKMDLSEAEAAIDVINAKNIFALKAGAAQLKGTVSKKIRELRNSILDEVSFIEAAIDDPEHYDLEGFGPELREHLMPVKKEIRKLIERSDFGSMMKEGVRTVIAGRPNAGKSSLLNQLSGYEKAIVTEIAGTTRDVLEEQIQLKNISLILMDTAGIRQTEDQVEKIGVNKAMEALKNADLILYLVDSTEGITEEDREVLKEAEDRPVIVLFNKQDKVEEDEASSKKIEEMMSALSAEGLIPKGHGLKISALTGEGMEELESCIIEMYDDSDIQGNDQVLITSARQKNLLIEAEKALKLVDEGIDNEMSEEFLTIDMMNAYIALGEIIGEQIGDDVADRVFEKFCMGK